VGLCGDLIFLDSQLKEFIPVESAISVGVCLMEQLFYIFIVDPDSHVLAVAFFELLHAQGSIFVGVDIIKNLFDFL
jgi:hypothetical protein